MSKTTRKWILAGFLLLVLGALAVSVKRNIAFELGNKPSYAISTHDKKKACRDHGFLLSPDLGRQ